MTATGARHCLPLRTRLLYVLVVAGVLTSLTPATAGAGPRRTLGSTLRVTGTGAAYERVRLARPLPRLDETTIKAVGDDGWIAVMLVAETDLRKPPHYLLVDRVPLPAGGRWQTTMSGVTAPDGRKVLPAGNYRLYVVASRRTTVTIPLRAQPPGSTNVTTRTKVAHRVRELPAQRVAGQYRPVSETSDTFTFGSPGMAMSFGVLDYSAMSSYSIGGCYYEGAPPAAEAVAQACAGGRSGGTEGGYVVPTRTPGRVTGGMLTLPIHPRTVSFGLYYQFAGTLTNVRQFVLFLEFLS